jgi:uncharacterized repeat protein (TIGR01451 family)
MSKMFLKMSLGMLAAAGLALAVSAAVPGTVRQLPGHVPKMVSKMTSVGRLVVTNRLHLSIGLPLRNQEALTNLLQQIYDPASPNYHHFLTPDQFTAQFGPTEEDYQAVLDFARTNNLTVTHTPGNRMLMGVEGNVADVERTFHVTLRTYHHPTEARDFFAPDTEPTVDAALPVLAIQGLNNYVRPRPMLHKVPVSRINPALGSAPGGGYIGSDFRTAYAPGTTLSGSGQTVGLLEFDGYYSSDILTYESFAGLPNAPLQNVLLDGFDGTPGVNNDEVCLDIETSISMAPGLSSVVVFEAGPFGNPDDILNSMAVNNQIKQLSSSWGYATDATSEQIYQEFALQGQTYLNCSGDGDAWLGPIIYASCEDPNATIVGGTTLTMNGSAVSYASETVWNWGNVGDYGWNPDGYAGSSGGISTDVSIPSWQQGINMTSNQGSTTRRNVPDVALTADNVFIVSSGGNTSIVGGTSAATPLWAGFMALVNQQAAISNKLSIGFLNPAVYSLAQTASYTNCFHDITTGNNFWDQSPTSFSAVPGYDLCTGLGTPNGINLINALVTQASTSPPVISAPASPWGTNLAVLNGSNPNGAWFLFVQDDAVFNVGTINSGWFVTLTTANPVGYAADNQLYATPTNSNLTPNTNWIVYLAVTNYGPSTSTNVFVTDTLPLPFSAIALVSSNATAGSVVVSGDTLTWTVNNLTINTGAALTLNFLATAVGTYTNSAVVDAFTTDPNPDDNSAAAVLNVSAAIPPQLTPHFNAGNGTFQLTVNGTPGQSVIIQESTNLLTWVPILTNTVPFTNSFATTNYPAQFYRAVVGP